MLYNGFNKLVLISCIIDAFGDALCGGAVMVYFVESIGGTIISYGNLMIAWQVFGNISCWIMGILVDKIALYIPLITSCFGSVVGYFSIAISPNMTFLLYMTAFTSLFDSTGDMLKKIVKLNVPESERASFYAKFTSITNFFYAFVPLLGSALSYNTSPRTPFFVVSGISFILFLIIIYNIVKEGFTKLKYTEIEDNNVNEEKKVKKNLIFFVIVSDILFYQSANFNNFSRVFFIKDKFDLNVVQTSLIISSEGIIDTIVALVASKTLNDINQINVYIWAPLFMFLSSLTRFILPNDILKTVIMFILSVLLDCISGNFLGSVISSSTTTLLPFDYIGRFKAFSNTIKTISGIFCIKMASYFYNIDNKLPFVFSMIVSLLGSVVGILVKYKSI